MKIKKYLPKRVEWTHGPCLSGFILLPQRLTSAVEWTLVSLSPLSASLHSTYTAFCWSFYAENDWQAWAFAGHFVWWSWSLSSDIFKNSQTRPMWPTHIATGSLHLQTSSSSTWTDLYKSTISSRSGKWLYQLDLIVNILWPTTT